MASFTLRIDIKGSALREDLDYELPRLIREVADKIADGRREGNVLDINGNACGSFKVTGKR